MALLRYVLLVEPPGLTCLATDYAESYGDLSSGSCTATVRFAQNPDDELDHAVDANEQGLKDTVRVNPNEIVELAVRFETYGGRYMYHCHILEHEDRDMMRPFVVMPAQLMPFIAMDEE